MAKWLIVIIPLCASTCFILAHMHPGAAVSCQSVRKEPSDSWQVSDFLPWQICCCPWFHQMVSLLFLCSQKSLGFISQVYMYFSVSDPWCDLSLPVSAQGEVFLLSLSVSQTHAVSWCLQIPFLRAYTWLTEIAQWCATNARQTRKIIEFLLLFSQKKMEAPGLL